MSLITCCPACGTMFKVVPDQLKVSEGWVRCGHCSEVFDAAAHMQAPVQQTPEPVPVPAAMLLREPAREPEVAPPAAAFAVSSVSPLAEAAPAGPPPAATPAPVEGFFESEPLVPSPLDQPFVVYPPEAFSAPAAARAERPAGLDSGMSDSEVLDTGPPPDSALDDVSFVRQARRKAFWRRPAVRAALVLLLVVLAALLGLQFAVHERERLAAVQPGLRPVLEQLCVPLNCTVGPLRLIEAIAVEGSSFNKLRGDTYRLNLTLRNQAPLPVAMPSVELTLTDSQDQPVLRRVLQPGELGGNAGTLAAASEWSAGVALAVAPPNGSAGRIAGYRVLAFYP